MSPRRPSPIVAPALIGILLLALGAAPLAAEARLAGDLPRAGGRPLESIAGLDSLHDVLTTRDGVRLRTILTRPSGSAGRLPAILFVQWLSCDSIELRPEATDGWSRMLRRVAQESGLALWRTEKRGVGDSEGDCSALDYETELADHRQALAALRRSPWVDPDRVVVFGASMGGNFAPLVADGQSVAGVIVWGGGAKTWFERTLGLERRRRELAGSFATIDAEMERVGRFLAEYLLRGQAPRQIAAADPALGAVWSELLGTAGESHYGRPVAFHQQAQRQRWAAAWSRVTAPVLVLYGEYDWFEDAAGHALIARSASRRSPGGGTFQVIPKTDHHFNAYPTPEAAFAESDGTVAEGPAVEAILLWLRRLLPATADPRRPPPG